MHWETLFCHSTNFPPKSSTPCLKQATLGRYELAYSANGATCNGTVSAATVTSAPPQPSATPEKTWSSERAQGKGYGVHNGERVYPDSHPPNAEKNGQVHSTRTHNGDSHERYRWSRCLQPLPLSAMRIKGVPSPPDNVEVGLLSSPVLPY